RGALALVTIFAAVPVGVLFGSSLPQYVNWAARGFADPAAFIVFLAALVLLLAPTGPLSDRFGRACGAAALFALALFLRPNLAPAAVIMLAGASLAALWQRQFRRVAGLVVGFVPVLGMALHNWVYGGVLLPFTSTARLAMAMPPSEYAAALLNLVHLNFAGEHVVRAMRQIGGWRAGAAPALRSWA